MDDILTSIKKRIAVWKVETGGTNADLAQALGIAESTLALKLCGSTEWKTPSEIIPMCKMFGCSPNELLGWK